MKNIDIVKSLSAKEFALLLIKEEIYADNISFVSLSGELFDDYDEAIKDCITWLNTDCE